MSLHLRNVGKPVFQTVWFVVLVCIVSVFTAAIATQIYMLQFTWSFNLPAILRSEISFTLSAIVPPLFVWILLLLAARLFKWRMSHVRHMVAAVGAGLAGLVLEAVLIIAIVMLAPLDPTDQFAGPHRAEGLMALALPVYRGPVVMFVFPIAALVFREFYSFLRLDYLFGERVELSAKGSL